MNTRKRKQSHFYVESAGDLPSIKDLKRSVSFFKGFSCLFGSEQVSEEARRTEKQLNEIISLIDSFYLLLGKRNWVFSNGLNVERMREVVAQPSPEEAERLLVDYLAEDGVLEFAIMGMHRFEDMRTRIGLLSKAAEDYLEGRYYSSVLVVVSVMDGFVNDVDKSSRKGLHARSSEEMFQRDCVATMWQGLPSVQGVFTKSIAKREDRPVYDVYRHGIMHGMTECSCFWTCRRSKNESGVCTLCG